MSGSISESTVESAALDCLASLDWTVLHGPDIAPDTPAAERADYGEVVLTTRLRSALARLNPDLPDDALEDALRRLTRPAGATLEARNRDFHRMLVAGVTVEHVDAEGRVRGAQVRVLDFGELGRATTGSPSTSSRSSRTSTNGGPTSCCSSTACRSPSSS